MSIFFWSATFLTLASTSSGRVNLIAFCISGEFFIIFTSEFDISGDGYDMCKQDIRHCGSHNIRFFLELDIKSVRDSD